MKRSMMFAAAALFLAGAAYPILALDGKKTTEPTQTLEKKSDSPVTEVKPSEPMVKDVNTATPVGNETKELKPSEPMAKDATTPPAVNETKPSVTTPSTSSVTETMTDKAKEVAKDKVVDAAKDKAVNAATTGMKTPSVDPTAAATKATADSIPSTSTPAIPAVK